MKKILGVGVILLFLVLSGANSYNINDNNIEIISFLDGILYVGGDGPDNYTKIQDAINDANNGDTIIVYPKNYKENIIVYKELKIVGIDYPVIEAENRSKDAVKIIASNCAIEGFKITNGQNGIKIRSHENEIRNNILTENNYSGIYIKDSSNIVASENTFQGNSYCGVYMRNCDRISLFKNNFSSTGHGISGSSITNCEIMNNNFLEGDTAIQVNPVSFNCKIYGNEIKSYSIGISNEGPNLIYHNNIISNTKGIFCLGTWETKAQIYGNNITNNKHGISLMNIWLGNVEIRRNNFIGNKTHAEFVDAYFILWYENYWDDWKIPLPKPIFGLNGWGFIPWFQFDWHPLMQPYEWWRE